MWALLWAPITIGVHCALEILAFAVRRPDWAVRIECSLHRSLFGGLRMRLQVEGREHLPAGRSFVAMANHQSYLDIPALTLSLRPSVVLFVAKRELGRIPLLGWAVLASHHIKVDRGNREQAVAALREAIRKVHSGVALGVFAEGTRSPDGKLLPFKKGGFYVAVDSGLPILPVSISGTSRLFGKRSRFPRPGTIHVRIHPMVVPGPGGRAGIPALLTAVRAAILSGVPEAREREPGSASLGADAGAGASADASAGGGASAGTSADASAGTSADAGGNERRQ